MNCVYILFPKAIDSYYVGETIDLDERLEQHNAGFYEIAFTKQSSDWTLFYAIYCDNRSQARKIETHIKK